MCRVPHSPAPLLPLGPALHMTEHHVKYTHIYWSHYILTIEPLQNLLINNVCRTNRQAQCSHTYRCRTRIVFYFFICGSDKETSNTSSMSNINYYYLLQKVNNNIIAQCISVVRVKTNLTQYNTLAGVQEILAANGF